MNIKKTILIIIIILIILFLYRYKENNTGALVQLYAKGPQDYYLTGTDGLYPYYYFPYYFPYYYPYYSRYYYPTRLRRRYFY